MPQPKFIRDSYVAAPFMGIFTLHKILHTLTVGPYLHLRLLGTWSARSFWKTKCTIPTAMLNISYFARGLPVARWFLAYCMAR